MATNRLDYKDLQRGDPLPVGRQFPDLHVAVGGRDRLDPFAGMVGQILVGQKAAGVLNRPGDGADRAGSAAT